MRLDRHRRERPGQLGDAGDILPRHRSVIEEVARVVELQPVRQGMGELLERTCQLRRDRADRRGALERPAPQIAERTGEWTFRAREEYRNALLDVTRSAALSFEHDAVCLPGIDRRLRRPEPPNARPPIRRGG